MANNTQTESAFPTPDSKNQRTSSDLLPRFFRTEANKKFLQATLDQLIQPGVAEKLNSYYGRKTAKSFVPGDNYIIDVNNDRQNYQLEPATVIKDNLDNVTFYKDYNDYINQLSNFGANVDDHSRLNSQESYAWNPNIDWDKFVNFREYYWAPTGPLGVPVIGQGREVVSTYTVKLVDNGDNVSYLFTPDGFTANPTLKLYRGQTYRFEIDTPGHPLAFSISRSFTPGNAVIVAGSEGVKSPGLFDAQLYGNDYDTGEYIVLPSSGSVTFNPDENVSTIYPDGIRKIGEAGEEIANVYVEKGVIEFTIPFNAPDRLYYISRNDINVSGRIKIYDIEENSFLNVDADIVGKKTYKSNNGVQLSNGMKIYFRGNTEPAIYETGSYYVEGVGTAIALIKESDLILPTTFTGDNLIPYDSDKFDTLPFSNASTYANAKDYLVINRSSRDRNPWSRYNRWFHKDVLIKSFELNGLPVDIDESSRAKRPIIEFEAGLKLYNYGTSAKLDVDLIDTFTTDVFSTIEGQIGYNIDGVELAPNMRVLFAADKDILVKGKIYLVKFVRIGNNNQISLIETEDTLPLDLETVFVKQGVKNAGKTFHYHGDNWIAAQEKLSTNQSPMFDLCCPLGNQYADQTVFESSSFRGTKVFSYKQGTGSNDPELGFPLTYRNLENSGDIVFEFNLLTDSFTYQTGTSIVTVGADTANLKKYSARNTFEWVNAWSSVPTQTVQKVIRQYIVDAETLNNFEIDVYNNAGSLTDLKTYVFLNRKFQELDIDYEINRINNRAYITFNNDLEIDDVVLIKTTSNAYKNANGWYEIPINLERNPLNEDVTMFTLGEVIDHVDTMVEDIPGFTGNYPGRSNLRDLGNLDVYGKRFVKHSSPINLPLYHITNKNFNIVKAIEYSKNEYARFKRIFVSVAENLGYDGPIKTHVDKILFEINRDKIRTQPFYFSDMAPTGSANKLEYKVLDPRNPYYALSSSFDLTELGSTAVLVYLNNRQLSYGVDYTFDGNGFVLIDSYQKEDDTIEIYEYSTTDGSYIPPTPTKLGLYPRFAPELTIDDTFIAAETSESGPFKIYGEIDTFNDLVGMRGWFYPVYTSKRLAQAADSNGSATLLNFKGLNKLIYIPTNSGNFASQETFEYDEYPIGVALIRGHDGSLVKAYRDYRDELILDLENRIYNNIKSQYNTDLLDINNFIPSKFRKTGFTRQEINNSILKDFIQWLRLVDNDYTVNDFYDRNNQFTFNYSGMNSAVDGEFLPGFWRGVYKEMYDTDRPHSHPWEMLGFNVKPSWWNEVYGPAPYTGNNLNMWTDLQEGYVREPGKLLKVKSKYARPGLLNYIPVDGQGSLRSPISANYAKNFFFRTTTQGFVFGDHSPVESAWRRSSEYPFAILRAWLLNKPATVMGLGFDVSRIEKNLAGQYIYKPTKKSITLADIEFPNTVQDNQRISTSGLVNYVYNLVASNVLKVYDDYKTDLTSITNQLGIKVGGFTDKNKFKLILDSRSPLTTQENNVFIPEENFKIFLNTSSPLKTLNYSGVVVEKVPGGFVVRGYNEENPFFEYYAARDTNSDITISVGGISESTVNWDSDKQYFKGQIVVQNFKYYRVINNFRSGNAFSTDNLAVLPELPVVGGKRAIIKRSFNKATILKLSYGTKLASSQEVVDFLLGYEARLKDQGFKFEYFNTDTNFVENWDHAAREFLFWTTQGWAVGTTISLSPGSKNLQLETSYSVVDDVFDEFFNYGVLNADGRTLPRENISIYRNQNAFELTVKNTDDGLYNLSLPLVQKEHVILIDNKTVFNDVIYQTSTGYRQERIKVLGYRSDNWVGGLDIPGFVYDEAKITEWTKWKDYNIGDLVKYKQFYYVAVYPVIGSENFESSFWYRLNEKPVPKLYTNFDYKINQFADFYDLDSDNFDSEQQRMAQHLIGYQKRNYLANIINDDVSQYKFYQGFIQDKGTRNAITKLFDPLSSADKDSIEFYEEWAIQVGRYGSTDDVRQVEYVIQEDKIKESPQPIELVTSLPIENFDKVYRIKPDEVLDKPDDYNHKPFPTTTLKEYILSGGYVHEDDIQYKAGSYNELASGDINQLNLGEYIWLTDNGNDEWTVYQVAESIAKVTALTDTQRVDQVGNLIFTMTLDKWASPILNSGDVVAIKGAQDYSVNGMYKVNFITGNTVEILLPENSNAIEFSLENFVLIKLREVRVDDLVGLNALVQEDTYPDQTVWVDNYSNNLWGVYKNNPVYTERQTLTNPALFDSTDHEFSSSMSVTKDNNNLIVSAPGVGDGVVYYYRRTKDTNNLVQDPPILPPEDLFDITESRFGESVSVSEDGKYLAIGIPDASNVKTKFLGDFNPAVSYIKNDVIRYRESLWKANKTILPEIDNQPYSTFDTYVNLASLSDADSTTLKLLLTGNPGVESETNHILVRAPLDMYLGTTAGDRVKLGWNIRSYAYPTLDNYLPFDNNNAVTVSVLDNIHTIEEKIDHIFLVPGYVALPVIGDFVTTDTGSAEVHYVYADGDTAVMYLKNATGTFDISGELFVNEEFIGFYSEEETYNLSTNLGGFWLINVSTLVMGGVYNNNGSYYETGRGLVYVDVLPPVENTSRDPFEYFNIQNTVGAVGPYITKNNQASFITHLSYYGDPYTTGVESLQTTNKWVVRASKEYTDILEAQFVAPGSSENPQSEFRLYDLDNRVIDIARSNFSSYDILNKKQIVVDLWDGYIDFDYTRFNAVGEPYEPVIGDILEDVQTPFDEFGGLALTSFTTSSAEVVFYQRNFNSVRVYVKNITGNWLKLNNIGRVELRRNANIAARGAGDVARVTGTINDFNNDVVLGSKGNSLIGKLIVFESDSIFTIPAAATSTWNNIVPIVDEEYWFFDEELAVPGAARLANTPSGINKDYTQIYNIPADRFGTASGLTSQGAVALYYRLGTGKYVLQTVITSEYSTDSKRFGKQVKLVKKNGLYTLLVSSEGLVDLGGNPLRSHPGSIEIFYQGYSDDTQFAGEWSPAKEYTKNQIVVYNGSYFRATKNISNQSTLSINDPILWNKINWKQAKDENYRGALDTTYPYAQGAVAYFDNKLYRANTNIAAGSVLSSANWSLVTDSLDYLGYLPNLTLNDFYDTGVYDPADNIFNFSKQFDVSADGSVLVTVAELQSRDSSVTGSGRKQLVIYRLVGNQYSLSQIIDAVDNIDGFADSIAISPDGSTIAVTEPFNDDIKTDQGKVYIYKQVDGAFVYSQTLESPQNEESEKFGFGLSFSSNNLVVSSLNGDMKIPTTFDGYSDLKVAQPLVGYTEITNLDNLLGRLLQRYDYGIDVSELQRRSNTSFGIQYKYKINDLIRYENKTYRVISEITEWPANWDPAKFQEVGPQPIYYNYNIKKGQLVSYRSVTYRALTDTTYPQNFDLVNFEQTDTTEVYSKYVNDESSKSLENKTTFDMEFTTFRNVIYDTGVVYVFENIEGKLVFSESFRYSMADAFFGENLLSSENHIYVGMPRQGNNFYKGTVLDYRKGKGLYAWNKIRELIPPVDVSKLRGAFLYNKRTNQIVTYLDYIDPIQGKIAGPAEQEITHKVGYDPATYNVSLYTSLDTNMFWAEEHVGEVWWNVRSAKFVYPYQGDIQYQKANWNVLQPEATVNVYEWVESDFPPSGWDEQADTEAGMQLGISGNSVYGDSQYSRKLIYDYVSQTFTNKYYFWVERKLTIPDVENRSISVYDIARLIAQPRQQGYRFISFASENRFILNNCDSLIYNDDIVLNVRYSTGPKPSQNVHNVYHIMSDGLSSSTVHPDIERKWFDSLIGYDEQLRQVPNPKLTVKQKYGVQNRPRQGMFVNRTEALKQLIERINLVLKQNIVVDEYDISPLLQKEEAPLATSNEYDLKIDTVDELRFVGTNKVSPATLTPVIVNGRLVSVRITNPGRGYKVPPSYKIFGTGTGAEITLQINNIGQVIGTTITSRGSGYDENTRISVRAFTVLVDADSSVNGKWALYSWDDSNKQWFRKSIQDFDVSLYWNYIDWYDTGYNEFTIPDFTIEQSSDLIALDDNIGDLVKINNVGSGGWLLLEKEADEDTEDYTINYKTVGRQNGTLEFLDNLYDFNKNTVGFDNRSYDSNFYDNNPVNELRIILKTIRDNIFINSLKVEFNQLFFASLRYILAEQSYVDWMFKTSFVKAKHNLGMLEQDVTFNTDTLESYRSYIEEVKPFKTVIREFVSAYDALDNTNSAIADFDLPPVYNDYYRRILPSAVKIFNNTLVNPEENLSSYPRKFWLDNHGYSIKEIIVNDAGSGYTYKPVVKIVGGGGSGATAEAYLGYGKITKIKVTNPGTGYTSAPSVVIEGSLLSGGSHAVASAIIGNGLVRTPSISIKFDRIAGSYSIDSLNQTETFYGTNLTNTFDLNWPMDLSRKNITVTIDGEEQLRSTYSIENVTNTDTGYTREQGRVTFVKPPAYLAEVLITYKKPLSMLNAADRINYGYNPLAGMFGKDLAQLMDGVDYGGVEITSFDFGGPAGWDTKGWYTDTWDTFDNSYEDQVFTFDGSTTAIEMPAPFESGVTYNVYLKRAASNDSLRIDDPNYGTPSQTNPNALMPSIVGDGVTTVVDLGYYGFEALDNDIMIVRKTTSDGSFIPDPESYDTSLTGGDLVYSTATGMLAEDIVVDGDGFVTPTTSKGPEELVPGQVLDTLDIKVYTRDSGGPGLIYCQNYVMDAAVDTYELGVIPGSKPAVIVKVDNTILGDDEYTINWTNNTVTILNPQDNVNLNIITVERTGQDILDFGTITSNGTSSIYVTTVEYVDGMSMHVTVNGVKQSVTIVEPSVDGRAAFEFETIPVANAVIHYTAFSNSDQVNYSQITKDKYVADGSTNTFMLTAAPFYSLPSAYNVIVKVDNKILNAGYSRQFTIPQTNSREFLLETFQQPGNALQADDVKVYLNGTELSTPVEWRLDVASSSVIVSTEVGDIGDTVEIFVVTDGEYQLAGALLTLDQTPADGAVVEIYNFSNHNIPAFERINYDVVARDTLIPEDLQYVTYNRLTVGEITLRKPAFDVQYVWVVLNGDLLSPTVDYYLAENNTKIRLVRQPAMGDVIDVIHFAGKVNTPKFAFRQFKDMLNRTHYKRLDAPATKLTQDLNYYDLRIELDDASGLPTPNKANNIPGIIFIEGERIEYLVKEGNTLRQLRRGTLGTGVKNTYTAGTNVYEQGVSKNIPYKDVTQIQEAISTGVNTIPLNFTATSVDEFEVFVAGRRLNKSVTVRFDPTIALDSPDGDVTYPPEFVLDTETNSIVLYEVPSEDAKINIVRKVGKLWNDLGASLGETQNDIGYFLRAGTTALPE